MARGDVLWVELPPPIGGTGREQTGRRPAGAVQIDESTPTIVVVPVTSQLSAERFPYTVRVQPSVTNGLSQISILLVFQMRALDRIRVIGRAGRLEVHYLAKLDEVLRQMLGL
jgi:mRNA interferase MazF